MAVKRHKIRAYLYDNVLTKENANDFVARVISERSLGVRDICESAVERGGADISATVMEYAVNLWFKEMGYSLCDGFSVNTGWFTAGAHIKGVFDTIDENYHSDKHTLLFEFHQGAILRKELEGVEVQIMGKAEASIVIAQVVDLKTGSVNDLVTPNRNLQISGYKLKIAGNEEDANGVFFINQETMERTKVDPTDIVKNYPSQLVIITPPLGAGTYKVEITTQYSSNLLKKPHTAVFDKILTVT
jgi:hypothetical protein